MARPLKTGLDFFSVDIDMDEDDKIIDMLEELGSNTGMGALYYILNAIYKSGYYLLWNDSVLKKLCRKKHLDKKEIEKAIKYLTGTNLNPFEADENPTFFDYNMYKDHKILTSNGVQKRYLLACLRRKKIIFDRRFILLNYEYKQGFIKKKIDGVFHDIERIGFWVEFDNRDYPIEFETNGIITDNINPVNADNNPVNDNSNESEIVNVYNNSVNESNSTQIEIETTTKESEIEIEIENEKRLRLNINSSKSIFDDDYPEIPPEPDPEHFQISFEFYKAYNLRKATMRSPNDKDHLIALELLNTWNDIDLILEMIKVFFDENTAVWFNQDKTYKFSSFKSNFGDVIAVRDGVEEFGEVSTERTKF